VTPALAEEIKALMAGAPRDVAFRMPRVTWHLGRWIRSTDWYPDHQLRLYDRRSAEWTGRYVHEAVSVRGRAAAGELQHYRLPRNRRSSRTIDRYTTSRAPDAETADAPAAALPATAAGVSCATTSRTAAFATACPASSSRR
jgi:hypothetical protein